MKLVFGLIFAAVAVVSVLADKQEMAEVEGDKQETFCEKYPGMNLCQLRRVLDGALEELDILSQMMSNKQILPEGSAEIDKRKSAFVRFGKRKSAFVRFGKRDDPEEMKRKSAFVRFGRSDADNKRKSSYIRFGKK